jgi:positive regulator of sigma E activity
VVKENVGDGMVKQESISQKHIDAKRVDALLKINPVYKLGMKIIITSAITVLIIFIVLALGLLLSQKQKETFLSAYCNSYTDCVSCANASGCSWCPKGKTCLNSTLLKSTDKTCNQMNTINSAFRCTAEVEDEIPPDSTESNDILYDFSLYKNKITDKIPPPNLYMAGKVKYSVQDAVSNANNVRNDLNNYQIGLPGIISSSVENQIKPMVKGILSENYYIQGFEDLNAKKCKEQTSCSSCVTAKSCGWDPLKLSCDIQGPNKTTYITQPQRCVTTPATLNLMRTSPN